METATQTLHRLTCMTWDWYARSAGNPDQVLTAPVDDPRVLKDFRSHDLARLPWFYKRYAQPLPRVSLPRNPPPTKAPAVAVLAGAGDVGHSELNLPQLSRVLHLSAGIVRTMSLPYTTWLFRAAGSAGGRFPLELYVAVPEGPSVPSGVHWYDPSDHALVRSGHPRQGKRPPSFVTGVFWRTGWKYRERGFRHVFWDAGTMLAHVLAVADSAGLDTRLHTRFPNAAVAALIGADGVDEWPVAVVALGDGTPALEATGLAAAGGVDAARVEFPLVTLLSARGIARSLARHGTAARPSMRPRGHLTRSRQ